MTATIEQAAKDLLRQSLEEHPGAQLFVLLDPSRDTKITTIAQGLSERAECLYIGSARQEFEDDAPWLVQCGEMDGFSDYLVDEGLGQHWCVFVISDGSFDDLFRHFRHLTKIRQVDGESLFFRYYDPDVLGSILPFLTGAQRKYVFGPAAAMLMEVAVGPACGFGKMQLRETGDINTTLVLPPSDEAPSPSVQEATIGDPSVSLASIMTFDLNGAGVRPVLTLTQAQLEAPILFNRPKLVASTIAYLEEDFGQAMKVMPPVLLAQNINHGIDIAMNYRIFDVSHIHLFVDLMMRVAPGWHRQPKLREVLTRAELSPEDRFEIMLNRRYDDDWEDARRFDDPDEWIGAENPEKRYV